MLSRQFLHERLLSRNKASSIKSLKTQTQSLSFQGFFKVMPVEAIIDKKGNNAHYAHIRPAWDYDTGRSKNKETLL